MQAGAVDLVHLPGRSVLEPFQLTVCKGEGSSCCSCTVLTSVVCEGELGAAFPSRGSCGFPTCAGDFCPGALPLPLWLTHGSFGSCGYSPPPPQGLFGTDWGHSDCHIWWRTLSPDGERAGVLLRRGRTERPRNQDSSKANQVQSQQCKAETRQRMLMNCDVVLSAFHDSSVCYFPEQLMSLNLSLM